MIESKAFVTLYFNPKKLGMITVNNMADKVRITYLYWKIPRPVAIIGENPAHFSNHICIRFIKEPESSDQTILINHVHSNMTLVWLKLDVWIFEWKPNQKAHYASDVVKL